MASKSASPANNQRYTKTFVCENTLKRFEIEGKKK